MYRILTKWWHDKLKYKIFRNISHQKFSWIIYHSTGQIEFTKWRSCSKTPRQVLEDWDPIGIKNNLRTIYLTLKESINDTPPKFNSSPLENHGILSFWNGPFSGAMFNFQGVLKVMCHICMEQLLYTITANVFLMWETSSKAMTSTLIVKHTFPKDPCMVYIYPHLVDLEW